MHKLLNKGTKYGFWIAVIYLIILFLGMFPTILETTPFSIKEFLSFPFFVMLAIICGFWNPGIFKCPGGIADSILISISLIIISIIMGNIIYWTYRLFKKIYLHFIKH